MKLTVRYFRNFTGNDIPVLCDEQGRMLPCQKEVIFNAKADDLSTLTVTFVLDGHEIRSIAEPIVGE